jgi:lysophospholipase L1-like esterase
MKARKVLGRIALLAIAIGLALVFVEAVLQAGALAMRLTGRQLDAAPLTTHGRIVTLGDSNMYGVMVERDQAYPSVLEALWNAGDEAPIEVLNLGYPGTNSSQVRRLLPKVLDDLAPDLVLVMVGANDLWTAPVPLSDASDDRPPARAFLEENSRAWKLAYMLARALDLVEVEVDTDEQSREGGTARIRFGGNEFDVGWEAEAHRDSWAKDLRQNLKAIARDCEAAGVEVAFLAYHTGNEFYGKANPEIRRSARRSGSRIIDLEPVFDEVCTDPACLELLFWDGHPKTGGHRLIAETVLRELKETR